VTSTGDGRTDLVARRKGRLVTFLGNRRGGFLPVTRGTGLRGYVQLVGAGDVTGDGRADLWGRNRHGAVFLHRGRGGGTFGARHRVAGDFSGYDHLVGGVDYTGDAIPDLVARRTDGVLVLLPSRGRGTLGRALGPVLRTPGLENITGVGQVVGNDAPDLLAAKGDALVVVRNRGGFDLGAPIDTGQSFERGGLLLNAGDFTGDGHGDVIMRRRGGALVIFVGDGTGRLAAPVWFGPAKVFRPVTDLRVVKDVTGDGRPDLMGRDADGQSTVWPGNGADRVSPGSGIDVVAVTDARPTVDRTVYDWEVPVSDLRGWGPADVLVRDRDGHLYRINGTRRGYSAPRYLGEVTGYDLGG
jgi:hypothetical protein